MGDETVRQAITKGLDRDQINVIAGSAAARLPRAC